MYRVLQNYLTVAITIANDFRQIDLKHPVYALHKKNIIIIIVIYVATN